MPQTDISSYKIIIFVLLFASVLLFYFFADSVIQTTIAIKNTISEKSYLPVKVRITDCFIVEEIISSKGTSSSRTRGQVYGYYPRIIVEYTINNKVYSADSKLFLAKGKDLASAIDYLKKIAPGQSITYQQYRSRYINEQDLETLKSTADNLVLTNKENLIEARYNPKNPQQLNISIDKRNYWPAVLVLALFIVPIVILLKISFARIGIPSLFFPIITGLFILMSFSAYKMRGAFRTGLESGKPHISIDLSSVNSSKLLDSYLDPLFKDNNEE